MQLSFLYDIVAYIYGENVTLLEKVKGKMKGPHGGKEVPMTDNQPKPRIIDNPDAREIYVNKVIGSSFDGAAISVTLGCTRVVPERLDSPPPQGHQPSVYVAGRLTLTPQAAAELVNSLNGMLTAISKTSAKPN
jgi:hypothetical protein